MATGGEVLQMLIPTGGWSILGDDYEGIQFSEAQPITKSEFQAGFAQYDAWKAEQDAKSVSDKAALETKLTALGITADDLKALLS